jgi:hypothetical protein
MFFSFIPSTKIEIERVKIAKRSVKPKRAKKF